jgi:hypothetical protein
MTNAVAVFVQHSLASRVAAPAAVAWPDKSGEVFRRRPFFDVHAFYRVLSLDHKAWAVALSTSLAARFGLWQDII